MTGTDNLQGFTNEVIQEPTYPQYTNLKLGDGVFDQLMAATEEHIDKQFSQHRITTGEFSQLYLGNMQSVLQNCTQYLLGTMLIQEQRDKSAAETSLIQKQEERIEIEMEMLQLEKEKLKFQIEQLFPLEKQKLDLEVEKVRQEGLLIDAQIRKIDAEIDHLLAQEALMVKQGLKLDAEIDMLIAQETLMAKQADKIDKEIEFLGWKIASEKSNTVDGAADPGSLIGKQISLLTAQKFGFAGDIKTKMAKLHADYYSVWESVVEQTEASFLNNDSQEAIEAANTIAGKIVDA